MAYYLKYRASWGSVSGANGYLIIYEKDYDSGSIVPLDLQNEAIEISNTFSDLETPVIGLRCEFYVLNNKSNYFQLFELLTATERQFLVEVTMAQPTSATIFKGFLNVDTISHGYVHNQVMRLIATSYLSKLEHLTPTSILERQNVFFINLIDEILRSTGAEYNIRVNCKLFAEGDTLATGQTLFNKNGVNTEAFWSSDIDRLNSLEVLEAILLPLNCYIYWWDNYWYIEHFSDIWQTTVPYVEYVTGENYSNTDSVTTSSAGTVVNVSKTINDTHTLRFRDTAQEAHVVPGNRLIQVKFNSSDSLLLNLLSQIPKSPTYFINIPSTFVEITDLAVRSSGIYIAADIPTTYAREWAYYSSNIVPQYWRDGGVPRKGIQNAITRYRDYYGRAAGPQLGQKFEVTIIEETSITVSFSYSDIDGELRNVVYNDPVNIWRYSMEFWYAIYFTHNGQTKFLIKDDDTNQWYVSTTYGEFINIPPPEISSTPNCNKITVQADQFNKEIDGFRVSDTIPLGEVYQAVNTNQGFLITEEITEFNFVICGEVLFKQVYRDDARTRNLPKHVYWGDIHITTTNDLDFDIIEGSINTDFLNKKELTFFIGDNPNLNYTNGILQGEYLEKRVTGWRRDSWTGEPLINLFFAEKFRMYNATKQKLTSPVVQTTLLRPFSLYTESRQGGKKYVLSNYFLAPSEDRWDVTLLEYDNETEVEIIEGEEAANEVDFGGITRTDTSGRRSTGD